MTARPSIPAPVNANGLTFTGWVDLHDFLHAPADRLSMADSMEAWRRNVDPLLASKSNSRRS